MTEKTADNSLIRDFCIIAHIDHGKSTLADRILEETKAVDKRKFHDQMLDDMDLERERGITIKAKAVRLLYKADDGIEYILNLVDTPGHVDFGYEVAKSLSASDGAVLLVDGTQGIEAQTVANFYLAKNRGLAIIPVINKIDLSQVQTEKTIFQIEEVFGFERKRISLISAKEGIGVRDVLERVIKEIPSPQGSSKESLRAFIFDSEYDPFKGVALFVRVFEGKILPGTEIKFLSRDLSYTVEGICVFVPEKIKKEYLLSGEVGVIYCNIKNPLEVEIPEYITEKNNPTKKDALQCRRLPPMVFCGIFPSSPKDYSALRSALEKLRLSDSSFTYEPDNSQVLGYGFRCGFLGLLHMEIIQERVEREYSLDVVLTSPNVKYEIVDNTGEVSVIDNPQKFPDSVLVKEVREPIISASIVIPLEYMDPVCEFAKSRRGIFSKMDYLGKDRLNVVFTLPLQEVVVDFYDSIKSITKGYGSLDYEFINFKKADIVKVDILFNRKPSGVFSLLLHRKKAERTARKVLLRLKELIPRHVFEINIQAGIGSKIIASEKKPAMKKDVTSKCYGGDITRKRKLWEKQKAGKKKLKTLGSIQIPSKAFLEILKI